VIDNKVFLLLLRSHILLSALSHIFAVIAKEPSPYGQQS